MSKWIEVFVNNNFVLVNIDLFYYLESDPDKDYCLLSNDDTLLRIREPMEQVSKKIREEL